MRMICEVHDGSTYVYFETEKQFLRNEKSRKLDKLVRIDTEKLDYECRLSYYGDQVYVVSPKLSRYNYDDSKQSARKR